MNSNVLTPFPNRGLYALTDTNLCARLGLVISVEQAIKGGARVIQYRDKTNDSKRRMAESSALLELCRDKHVPLIVNDDVALTRKIGADGVHIGRDDGTAEDARKSLPRECAVGVSCYASVERAIRAQAEGATYVAFGSFYPSTTKPLAPPVNLQLIATRRSDLTVPVVGIGGITVENATPLIDAGIDLVAVVSGVFGTENPCSAAQSFARLFC